MTGIDEEGLQRICRGQIPPEVEAMYERVKRVWDRISGGSPFDAQVLALIVVMADADEVTEDEFIPRKGNKGGKREKEPVTV
jgi:hypothetical protein